LPKGVTVDAVDDIKSFDDVIAALREIYENSHGYQSLIVDTVDALEPLLHAHVCTHNGWKNMESASYGKAYILADVDGRASFAGLMQSATSTA
jgi:hypothetical protein